MDRTDVVVQIQTIYVLPTHYPRTNCGKSKTMLHYNIIQRLDDAACCGYF